MERDGPAREVERSAGFEESAAVGVFGVELRIGVFEDGLAVHFVAEELAAVDFDSNERMLPLVSPTLPVDSPLPPHQDRATSPINRSDIP